MPSLTAPYIPVPPRGEDLPYDDGAEMESERHQRQMTLLIDSLAAGWKERADFYVGGNMFLYYSETQAKRNDFRGPDVFVVLGTEKKERKSWVVWEEDGRLPSVIIELLSESTETEDRGPKMRIYASQLRVPFYYLFDPFTKLLEGYELVLGEDRYRRIPAEPSGDVACRILNLRLGTRLGTHAGIETEWLRWIAPDGRPLPTEGEEAAQRAVAAAELARAETERANAEAERADAAEARAKAERLRADELARRLAELEKQGP